MQQIQEKQNIKAKIDTKIEQSNEFKTSAWPTVLSIASKACYTAAGASVVLSVGVWNRHNIKTPKLPTLRNNKSAKKSMISLPSVKLPSLNAGRPSERQYHETQRLGMFVGLWTPTLVIAGKVLADASHRVAQYETQRSESQNIAKVRGSDFRNRFFAR